MGIVEGKSQRAVGADQNRARSNRGTLMELNLNSIPQELKRRDQWVAWKGVPKDNGKLDKIPISPKTGRNASHGNPETWGTFQQALARYQGDKLSGIGFVFSQDDPFCGIDLDGCRDPKTGNVEPWALEIIHSFVSYSELSQSGRGAHVITVGTLPGGGRKNERLEIYDHLRFFCVTGQHIQDTPKEIRDAQGAVTNLYDQHFKKEPEKLLPQPPITPVDINDTDLLVKILDSKHGDKFRMLSHGQWEEAGYPSQSEADQGLCNILAFWTGNDSERMDRLFRKSDLMRPKWDKKHHSDGSTYGEKTIQKAIAGNREVYNPTQNRAQAKPPDEAIEERAAIQAESREAEKQTTRKEHASISVNDLLQTKFEHRTPIVAEGILPQQAGMILAGEGGVGKSLIVLEWAIRLVMGWNILDVEVPTSRTVKIFQAENPMAQVQYRLKKIIEGFQITGLPNRIFFSNPKAQYDLGQKKFVEKIKGEIRECGADVFILDPLSSFHTINENDNILMRTRLDKVTWISRETGAAAIIIDHFGKPSRDRQNVAYRTRGAMSKRDWADTHLSITHREHENKILRQVDFIKIRNGPMRQSILVERDENFIHEIVEEDMSVSVSKVKEILEAHFGGRVEKQQEFLKTIASECGCAERTAQRAIYRAVEMKVIFSFDGPRKAKGYQV